MHTWHRSHAFALHQLGRLGTGVANHLEEHGVLVLLAQLGEEGGDDLARATPGGAVVHHHHRVASRAQRLVELVRVADLYNRHPQRRCPGQRRRTTREATHDEAAALPRGTECQERQYCSARDHPLRDLSSGDPKQDTPSQPSNSETQRQKTLSSPLFRPKATRLHERALRRSTDKVQAHATRP
eukprot:scaffold1023_cov313-Pinguiococcus_pyrenoidosus.AAC.29